MSLFVSPQPNIFMSLLSLSLLSRDSNRNLVLLLDRWLVLCRGLDDQIKFFIT